MKHKHLSMESLREMVRLIKLGKRKGRIIRKRGKLMFVSNL